MTSLTGFTGFLRASLIALGVTSGLFGLVTPSSAQVQAAPQANSSTSQTTTQQVAAPQANPNTPQVTAQPIMAQQTTLSLTAIPPRVGEIGEIKLKPGEKYQGTLKIMNSSEFDLEVETFAKDFMIATDGSTPIQVNEAVDDRWSLAKWLVVAPSKQLVPAKKTVNVNFLIQAPANARPGGKYAMVLHQPVATGNTNVEAFSTGINQQVGSLIYVTIDGPITESAYLRNFTVQPKFSEFGPVNFQYSVDNQSDIHLRPQAKITIKNLFGQKQAEIPVETQNIFPGLERQFAGTWPVSWGFGPYFVELEVAYGSEGQVLTAKETIWLLPISVIIALAILLLAIISAGLMFKKSLQKPANSTSSQPPSPPSAAS